MNRARAIPLAFPANKNRKLLIGVIHLRPLPGAARCEDDIEAILKAAVADAHAYEGGGADAVVVENFGDVPFTKGPVPHETIAAMATAGRAVRESVKLPLGFNVLRNDAHAALALCVACGGSFIRVNVHTGAMVTDQGVIEGKAFETLRLRRTLCPRVQIFADVHVKHAAPLAPLPIEIAARDTLERGLADALIVSGTGTGVVTDPGDVERVRAACPGARILIGSGTTVGNVRDYLRFADGVIVGTSLKKPGGVRQPVDERRVAGLARAMRGS
ncbi:MAG TPA: BtpA/SgcQ family protein [Verrucomicrobiae bacterium]|jgi:membrane complex biogenesis BtpA family protein